jgi:hypothetical protein
VTVRITGLPSTTAVLLGFGGIGSPHEILDDTVSSVEGVASWTVTVPSWVEASHTYLFYMAYGDQRPVAFSEPFLVVGPDGVVTLEGTITDEGVSCVSMRGPNGGLFTLAGAPATLSSGDRVIVEATVAEMSVCMQGLTLAVRELTPA